MDPTIAMIVAAVAAGATAAAKDLGGDLLKDAYGALKTLISDRYKRGATASAVEEDPSSEDSKRALGNALAKADAGKDAELVQRAKEVSSALETIEPEKLDGMFAVLIGDLKAKSALFENIKASGAGGLKVDHVIVEEDFTVRNIDVKDPK